jgi:hypothetical protein
MTKRKSEPKEGLNTGNAGKGRPKGSPNKTTAALKDAILRAAELSGRDMKGKEGLVGYLRRVADEDVKAFSGLLGKVLPLQVTGDGGGPVIVALDTADERL